MNFAQFLVKMKGLEPKYFFGILGLAVFLFVALDVGIMVLQAGGIAQLDRKMVQLRTDIDSLSANKQRMVQFRQGLDQARQQLKDFQAMVHQEDGIPAVLKTVSTIANQYAVKIDQLIPQKSDGVVLVKNEDGQYTSLSIVIRVRAGYHDLGRFINRLEQERVFWQLEGVDISADQVDPAQHVVKLQMKILLLGKI